MSATAPISLAELPLRPELRGQLPYGAPQHDVPVKLNTNENPYAPTAKLASEIAAAVAKTAEGLNRYPDMQATALRGALAEYLRGDGAPGITRDEVWAANGSNEVLVQLLLAFAGPGRVALSFAPTYSMYSEYARNTHTEWVVAERSDDWRIDPAIALKALAEHNPAVVILASPNNPTGTALPLADLEIILQATEGIVIVDEAYAEFRRSGTPSALSLLPRYPRLVVTRTMSKAFALAGARLGYMAAAPAVIEALKLVRLPYHLSTTSQIVAQAALRHADELLGTVEQLRVERDSTVRWLRGHGFSVAESDANFVLFGVFADRHLLWSDLLEQGVLLRETGPAGWLRVSIGTKTEMAKFRDALLTATALQPNMRS